MRINSPTIMVDGETCHQLEQVIEAGLRVHLRNGATIPDSVRTFARDVTAVAGHWRMTVQSSSGVGGVSGVTSAQESSSHRTMGSTEVAVLADITPSGVRAAHRCGRLVGRKVGRELRFNIEDVTEWLERSSR